MKYMLLFLLLSNCFGPVLFNVGSFNITVTDAITSPVKIKRIIPKNDENLEDYENKKL
jgi:hypothetical protein